MNMSADPNKKADIKPHGSDQNEPSQLCRRLYGYFCEGPAVKLAEHLIFRGQKVMMVAFDECSNLDVAKPQGHSSSVQYMPLVAVWRIIKAADDYSNLLPQKFQFWYAYLDTSSNAYALVPRRGPDAPSGRLVDELDPLPPFTALGFDQTRGDPSQLPKNALDISCLQRMGRPLWATATTAGVLNSADVKLFGKSGMQLSKHHILAAFSHRIALELANTEVASILAAESVAKHLRYLRWMVDRKFLITSAPSEPILSLVATRALRFLGSGFTDVIRILFEEILLAGLLVDKGSKGELVARLIVVLARDRAVLDAHEEFHTGAVIHTVTLAQFLSVLLPSIVSEPNSKLLEAAGKKHVNFSHFKVLNTGIHSFKPGFLRTAWDRGVAFQCCHNQPVVDIVLVTYSGDLSKPWDNSRLGTFAIQVQNRSKPANLALASTLIGPNIAGSRPEDEIVMLMDLGTSLKFSQSDSYVDVTYGRVMKPNRTETGSSWQGYLEAEQERARWCINARGIHVYPFLDPWYAQAYEVLKGLRATIDADETLHDYLEVGLDETKEADMCD